MRYTRILILRIKTSSLVLHLEYWIVKLCKYVFTCCATLTGNEKNSYVIDDDEISLCDWNIRLGLITICYLQELSML